MVHPNIFYWMLSSHDFSLNHFGRDKRIQKAKTKMSQHRYIALIDGEKIRGFHRRDELMHWLKDKPEATYVRYSVKREPKDIIDFSLYEAAPY